MNERITLDQFITRLQEQGVPHEHNAFRCVHCGHIQSAVSLVRYLPPEDAGNAAYCVCEGRFDKNVGCDWTLGGLFQIHNLEVISNEGEIVPVFDLATPEEAKALMEKNAGSIRTKLKKN